LRPLGDKQVGSLRWLTLAGDRILAVVPNDTKDLLSSLGRIADEYRVESDVPPREVVVYAYRIEPKLTGLSIRKLPSVLGQSLYTGDAGYFEENIRSTAELQTFLGRNLDLVAFRSFGDYIRLGGRTHATKLPSLITLEDLAALVKARVGLPTLVRSQLQRHGLRETYELRVN
jgi:hypothetical protein